MRELFEKILLNIFKESILPLSPLLVIRFLWALINNHSAVWLMGLKSKLQTELLYTGLSLMGWLLGNCCLYNYRFFFFLYIHICSHRYKSINLSCNNFFQGYPRVNFKNLSLVNFLIYKTTVLKILIYILKQIVNVAL